MAGLIATGCASISTPEGGPRDETPPRLVQASPAPGATNVSGRQMHLDFDEYVNIKDAFTNVVVSPTSASQPRVTATGRRVTILFTDTLQPNTTYSIDFANSISDNNEANELEGFSYTFATGPVLDTLRISVMVLDSHTLDPQQGILVGVHRSDADTVFSCVRMERVARTDDKGRFSLRGLAPGRYRLYALQDLNGDMRWDNPEERMAFFDDWIVPTVKATTVNDTIYNPTTLQVDTVVEKASALYQPNDILLSAFSLGYKPQYLKKSLRADSTRVELTWNATQAALPPIRLLNDPQRPLSDWALAEVREGNDSVALWLKDPQLIKQDTLRLEVEYLTNIRRDSVKLTVDTLTLLYKRPKPKALKKGQTPPVIFTDVKSAGATQEYPEPYMLTFGAPLDTIYADRIRLQQKKDTTWITSDRPSPLLLPADSLNPRKYKIDGPWAFGGDYRLVIDTLAIADIYGHYVKPQNLEFKVRQAGDYGTLSFNLSGLQDIPAFVELLNGSDVPIRTQTVTNGTVSFTYLLPGTYYARVIFDANGNGKYDTGDYDKRLQPEAVAYYPKKITLRKNWDQNLSWDVNATPVDLQKPNSVKKNRPKAKRHGNANEQSTQEEEDEYFDPNENPFDPNSRRNRNRNGINGRR